MHLLVVSAQLMRVLLTEAAVAFPSQVLPLLLRMQALLLERRRQLAPVPCLAQQLLQPTRQVHPLRQPLTCTSCFVLSNPTVLLITHMV